MPREGTRKPDPTVAFAKNILRKVFVEDWHLKLLALGITLALWFAVTGLSKPMTARFSNVRLSMRSSDNTITDSEINTIDLVLSGDARKINQIDSLSASVDLSGLQPGERTVTLTPANVFVPLPAGVKIDDIWPNRVQVKLERVEEKDVPVKIETTGDLGANLEVYSRTATPSRIMVRGPESVLDKLESISTEKIDLKGRTGDFTVTQPLAVTDSKATIQRGDVSVTFRIGEKRIEKVFVVPTGHGKNVRVVLYGPASLLQKRKPDELKIAGTEEAPEVTLPADMVNSVVVRSTKIL
ncbi:MAG: hypothetical protein KF756_03225 [Acidobacteria bacterium]|nr:hypothetical protein [Acidobacteriota bacterium]